jgi:hypothetical protein
MSRSARRFNLSAPRAATLFVLALLTACLCPSATPQSQTREEQEIIANLAGGRVIVHVARDGFIIFAAVQQPIEAGSIPPRVLEVDSNHVAILLGASEWRLPADPQPVRLDKDFHPIGGRDVRGYRAPDEAEPDLEAVGTAFLEELRPLVSQLHHKIDIAADEPLFEMVLIGFTPLNHDPEVWTIEYRAQQEQISTRGEYLQTRILRPRFEQLYPPDKHAPRVIVEARYPVTKDPSVMAMIQSGDPQIASLRSADARYTKVWDLIDHGQAQKAVDLDATDFLRAMLPLIAAKQPFFLGTMEYEHGMNWVVPPEEPVDKTKKAKNDKDRPPEAPTLRRRPND